MRAAGWMAVLTVAWVLLQGEVTIGNVAGGAAVGAVVLLAFPTAAPSRRHRLHPWAALRFVAFVLVGLVTSSARVAITSLWPTPSRVRSGIVRVDLPGADALVATVVANAITLTPGTLTVAVAVDGGDVEADGGRSEGAGVGGPAAGGAVLHVHVLGLGDIDAFRADVADLHARATRALTPVGVAP